MKESRIVLLAVKQGTRFSVNYRPITCLPTFYKIITLIIKKRIHHHLTSENMLPIEQKGWQKWSYGCKDQLLINKATLEEAKKKFGYSVDRLQKSIQFYTTWLDNQISPIAINFLKESMEKWKISVILYHQEGKLESREFNIKRKIFQDDSLSPLLFCLALAPLSTLLKRNWVMS